MKQRSTLTHAHFIFLVSCAAIIISLSTSALFGQGNSGNGGNGNGQGGKPPIGSLGPVNLPYWKLIGNSIDSGAFAGTTNNFPFKIKVNNILRASFTNSGMDLNGNLHSSFATVDSILTAWRIMVNDALSANTINAKQYFQNDTLVDLIGVMNSVGNLQSAVSNLSSAQEDQQFEIDSIQSAISGISDSVSTLTSQVSNLTSQTSDLTSQTSDLISQTSNLTSQVSDLTSQVSNLIGTVDTVVLNTVQVNEIITQSISSDTIYLSGPIMADTVQIPNELKLGDHSLYISGIKTGDPNSSNRIYSRDGDLMVQSIAGNDQNTIISYANSGMVGIGTNSPDEKLSVAGNMKVSGNSTITGNLNLSSLSGNQSHKLLYVDNAGNITATPPPSPIDLMCGELPIPWTMRGNNNTTADDFIGTCGNVGFSIRTNGDERIKIKSTGNVGIGISDPLAKVHISHEGTAMRFQRAGFESYDIRQSFNSGFSFVKASNNQVVLHLADTGNVGIGTDKPLARLDIRGKVLVQSNNFPGIQIINENTGAYQKATVEFINSNNGQQTGNFSQFLQVNSDGYSSFIMRRRIPDGTYFDYMTFNEKNSNETNNNIILNASKTSATPYGDVIVNNGNALIMNGKIGIGVNSPKASLNIVSNGSSTAPTEETANVANAGILLSSSYSGGVNYLPGLFWSNTNISTDKPAAGIWVKQNGGTDLYFGTGKNGGIASTVVIDQDGQVGIGIGTASPQAKLQIKVDNDGAALAINKDNNTNFLIKGNGEAYARDVFIYAVGVPIPDYVFGENYSLAGWEKERNHWKKNKHLLGMPSAEDVKKAGAIDMKEMQLSTLKKLEELYLYVDELKVELELQKSENKKLRSEIKNISNK